jgi:hypothetical protein
MRRDQAPGQVVLELLWLPDAGERVPADILDQLVDPREHLSVGLMPGRIVLPALVLEYQPHRALPADRRVGVD